MWGELEVESWRAGEVATTSLSSAQVLGWLRLEHLHSSWQEESLCRREERAGRGGAGSGGGFPLSLSLSYVTQQQPAASCGSAVVVSSPALPAESSVSHHSPVVCCL